MARARAERDMALGTRGVAAQLRVPGVAAAGGARSRARPGRHQSTRPSAGSQTLPNLAECAAQIHVHLDPENGAWFEIGIFADVVS